MNSVKIKEFLDIRKRCKAAGVAEPPEVSNALKGCALMPSVVELSAMRKEYKFLSKGIQQKVDFPALKLRLHLHIYWEEDDYASFEIEGVNIIDPTFLEKTFFQEQQQAFDDMVGHNGTVEDAIWQLKLFKDFNKRVKDCCQKAKKFESKYPGFDWYRDIVEIVEQ
ncbi:MAG: hypothetical protein M0R80_01505 [Proteobacteria bacterium]|jgi:hypothetical protein|nr:hypothetical protein [Pseudomonadota bacterium]